MLAAHIKENQLELKDATKSGSGSDPDNFDSPRYANYTLPGGQNYREMLLTMPDKTPPEYRAAIAAMDEPARRELAAKYPEQMGFHSSHWDEPNVLAHVRFNDRTVNGKKTLFIEEVQSDWHQQGKRSGYDIAHDPSEYAIEGNGPWVIRNQKTGDFVHYFNRKHDAEGYLGDIQKGKILPWKKEGLVPDAPFKTAWPELAMKRILKHAADNGYDQVAWTPGEVQAARYDLSRHIDRLEWERGGTSQFLFAARLIKNLFAALVPCAKRAPCINAGICLFDFFERSVAVNRARCRH